MAMNLNLKLVRRHSNYWIIFLMFLVFACAEENTKNDIPESCSQMILMITDSVTATKGYLYTFERTNSESVWKRLNNPTSVVLGRNGLGLGIGLHNAADLPNIPIKVEGDGRSPAGIFELSSVFGYSSLDQMINLKMPYHHITEMSECIDDAKSEYYNQIVSKDKIEKVDWNSSEDMCSAGIYYELGVVVDHNSDSIIKGSGSCIFLHNWADSSETMAGCTAMTPEKMKEIAFWLDAAKSPVLIQLTKQLYLDLVTKWNLPEVKANK